MGVVLVVFRVMRGVKYATHSSPLAPRRVAIIE